MRRIARGLVSAVFLLGSLFVSVKGSQAATTGGLETKKPDTLILQHQRDLKKANMIGWSEQSDWNSGRNHGSHGSHASHVSHYSSRY